MIGMTAFILLLEKEEEEDHEKYCSFYMQCLIPKERVTFSLFFFFPKQEDSCFVERGLVGFADGELINDIGIDCYTDYFDVSCQDGKLFPFHAHQQKRWEIHKINNTV